MKTLKVILLFIITSFVSILIYVYFPYIVNVFNYRNMQQKQVQVEIMRQNEAQSIISRDPDVYAKMLEDRQILVPISEEFGIVIPKIKANAKILSETDFMHAESYLPNLEQGVAHAMWSGYPNELSTTVLFTHADESFYRSTRLNSKFLLLDKLQEGDEIIIFYHGEPIKYHVITMEKFKPINMRYFDLQAEKDLIKISTHWPFGLDWRRLVVTAERES